MGMEREMEVGGVVVVVAVVVVVVVVVVRAELVDGCDMENQA